MGNITVRWYTDDGYKYSDADLASLLTDDHVDPFEVLGNLLNMLHSKGILKNEELTELFSSRYEFGEKNDDPSNT